MKPEKGNPQVGLRTKNWFLGCILVIVSVRKSRAICLRVKGLIVCKCVNPEDTNLVHERLSKLLIENNFVRGKIDKTLFFKNRGLDILVVQIYVDDIIFGATNE